MKFRFEASDSNRQSLPALGTSWAPNSTWEERHTHFPPKGQNLFLSPTLSSPSPWGFNLWTISRADFRENPIFYLPAELVFESALETTDQGGKDGFLCQTLGLFPTGCGFESFPLTRTTPPVTCALTGSMGLGWEMAHQTWSSILPGCKVRGVWFHSWPLGPLWLQGICWPGWGWCPHFLGGSPDQLLLLYDQLGSGGFQSSLRSTFCPQGVFLWDKQTWPKKVQSSPSMVASLKLLICACPAHEVWGCRFMRVYANHRKVCRSPISLALWSSGTMR